VLREIAEADQIVEDANLTVTMANLFDKTGNTRRPLRNSKRRWNLIRKNRMRYRNWLIPMD